MWKNFFVQDNFDFVWTEGQGITLDPIRFVTKRHTSYFIVKCSFSDKYADVKAYSADF